MHLSRYLRSGGALLASGFASVEAMAGEQTKSMRYNMTEGVTEISQSVYSLHQIILWICVIIGVIVFGAMFYSIFKHRKSKGVKPATFHESVKVEIAWTIVPIIILIGMAVPATSTLRKMEDTSDAELTIKVTGYQWKWRYEYIDYNGRKLDIDYFSNLGTSQRQIHNKEKKSENYLLEVDRPLYIPTGKKVRFLITANDVIHSWWVPAFSVKKDAIPGFINETWTKVDEPGTYRGQCAELCGKDHGFMPVVVKALDTKDFDGWLNTEQEKVAEAKRIEYEAYGRDWPLEELMTEGKKIYDAKCAACHMPNGEGIPGAFPALKDSAVALGDISKHIDVVVYGVQGTAMQAFKDQLNDIETAAVVTYERNAWGNDTGDAVQPRTVRDHKQQATK
jgi:cytochrome c oxidase subunit 2